MTKKIYNLAPIFFILLVWFIFASPFILKGLIPYPSEYQVNNYHPWSAYSQFWGPVKNAAMPDVIGQIYPWKHLTINIWEQNQTPLWNPYGFSGNPHLANFQSSVLSPFNVLFVIFPFANAWAILILLAPLIAGLSMYLLMKALKISNIGSLIASVAFMFCGFITVWMAYGTLSMTIAFLPLALFAIEKTFSRANIYSAILLSLTIIFSFFSGHFQTSLYFLILSFCFFIFKSFNTKNNKAILYILGAFIFGTAISLVQIIPSIIFYENSVRSGVFIKEGGIPIQYLITVLSPDFYGNPVTRNDWFGYYAEFASFIGIIPLFLASFSFFERKKVTIFFILAGTIAIFLAISSPFQTIVGSLHIPIFSTINPNRIIVLFSFCFSILAGIGFDRLRKIIKNSNKKEIAVVLGIWSIFMFILWTSILFFHFLPIDKIIIAKRNLVIPTLFFFIILASICIQLYSRFKNLLLFSFVVLALTSFSSLSFSQKWMPFESKNLIFKKLPVIDAIKKNIDNNRLFGNIGQEIGNYYFFQMIEGYDPLYIKRYGEFIRAANTGNFQEAERSVVHLDKRGKYADKVLDFLGVGIVFHRIQDTKASYAYPVWEKKQKYSLIFQDSKFQLYRNNTAMERAKLFYKYEVIENDKALLKRFYNESFDFSKILLLHEKPFNNIDEEGIGDAKIISYLPNKIVIKTQSNKPAILLLTDNFYPGWKAYVDGIEKKIYRADYTFRGVFVDKGTHMVVFAYNLASLFSYK